MERIVFKAVGVAMIFIGVASGVAASLNLFRSAGGRDLSPLFVYTVIGVPLGYAVMRLNRAAVGLASVILAWGGGGLAVISLRSVPLPFLLINLLFAGVLISPLVVALRWLWRGLRGRIPE